MIKRGEKMPIRREDKEFIQALSLLGAVFGACIGLIAVMHFSDRAHETYSEQTTYVETQAALLKLQSSVVNPNNPIADETVLNQVQKQMDQTPAQEPVAEKSFWVDMNRYGYIGLCAGGCVVGAIGGYSSIWLAGWVGSVIVLYSIRLLYFMIRRVSPALVDKKVKIDPEQNPGTVAGYQRDDGRILPVVVKLCFFVVLVLSLLAAIVWKLTAI
jgi:hypothetical protein